MADNEAREDLRHHLKMIQDVVSRMAQNSFLLKGWTITLIAALFALAAAQQDRTVVALGLVPTFGFWVLDAFYLRQERLFRLLYDSVRRSAQPADFTMQTDSTASSVTSYRVVSLAPTLVGFYGLSAGIVVVAFLLTGS